MKVVVTGAGGKTGFQVVLKLLSRPHLFQVVAVARSYESFVALQAAGVPPSSIRLLDIILPGAAEQLTEAFTGADALVIVTSAVPVPLSHRRRSATALATPPVTPPATPPATSPAVSPPTTPGRGSSGGSFTPGTSPPRFGFLKDQTPEQVDWYGGKLQIDIAKACGLRHVVLVGSMGGTNPSHFLNSMGRILDHKRRAEQYLIASGLTYTILHPAGLSDEREDVRPLIAGVDDSFIRSSCRTIPRAAVAEACVQSLLLPIAANRSIDLTSCPAGYTPRNRSQSNPNISTAIPGAGGGGETIGNRCQSYQGQPMVPLEHTSRPSSIASSSYASINTSGGNRSLNSRNSSAAYTYDQRSEGGYDRSSTGNYDRSGSALSADGAAAAVALGAPSISEDGSMQLQTPGGMRERPISSITGLPMHELAEGGDGTGNDSLARNGMPRIKTEDGAPLTLRSVIAAATATGSGRRWKLGVAPSGVDYQALFASVGDCDYSINPQPAW